MSEKRIHTQDLPEKLDATPPVMGMAELIAARSLGRLVGPKGESFNTILEPDALWRMLPSDARDEDAREVLGYVTSTYDRRLNKIGATPSIHLGPELAASATAVLRKVEAETTDDYKLGKASKEGIAKIVRDMTRDRALHYLDEEFVSELQDLVPEDSAMWNEIGNYFKIGELLRRAHISPNPDIATKESVKKAWEIAKDPAAYLRDLGVEKYNDDFIRALSPGSLLELTTRVTDGYDERLKEAAEIYDECIVEFPVLATHDAQRLVAWLLKSSHTKEKLADYERTAKLLVREGVAPADAVYFSFRMLNGKMNPAGIDRLVAVYNNAGRSLLGEGKSPRTDFARQRQALVDQGILTGEDVGMATHGLEYRDAMVQIGSSERFTLAEKKTIFNMLREARQKHAEYTYRVESVVGEKFSDNERRQYDVALTKSLYAFKYLIEHSEEGQVIPMGSKDVFVQLTKENMLEALSYLQEHARLEALVEIEPSTPENELDDMNELNLEIGSLKMTDSHMLLLSKLYRAPVIGNFEHGKSPRINRACAVRGGVPSLVASERENNCLSLRNDLDEDGMLRLDIGGKTEDLESPDFLVAKLISLGGWYYAQVNGKELTDYHVDIDMMSDDEFATIVRRYRRAVRYAATPLRIGDVPVQAARSNQGAAQILELHPRGQDQRPAA